MAKNAKLTTSQIYKYPVADVFRIITESIITQMQGAGREHNLNFYDPVGRTSDYTLTKGTRNIPVHFEILAFDQDSRFSYLFVVGGVRTEIIWELEEFDNQTVNVTYSEIAGNTSIFNQLIKWFNRKKFHRTANGYFYMIDSVLEQEKL